MFDFLSFSRRLTSLFESKPAPREPRRWTAPDDPAALMSSAVHHGHGPNPAGATKPDGTPADTRWAEGYVDEKEQEELEQLPGGEEEPDAGRAHHGVEAEDGHVSRTSESEVTTGDITVKKKTKTGVGLDEGGDIVVARSRTSEWGTTGDDEHTESETTRTAGGVNLKDEEAKVKRSRTHVDDQGNERTTSGEVTADLDGKLGGGVSHSTKDKDGNTTSVSGGGDVDMGENGIQGADAHASAGANGAKVSVKAGIHNNVSLPVWNGSGFAVTWRRSTEAGMGAGYEGEHGGGSASAGASSYTMGSKVFKTYQEALAFHDASDTLTHDFGPTPTTLEGAFTLAVGETRGQGSSANAGVEGSVEVEGAKVGLGGTASEASEIEVRRRSANLFDVTVTTSGELGGELTAGGPGVTATGESSDSTEHSVTVRFDLTTEEGKAAFEQYCATRRLPKAGGTVVATEDGSGHETSNGIELSALGGGKFSHRTWEKHGWSEDGTEEEYGGEDSEEIKLKRLGHWLGGEDQAKAFQIIGHQENDEELDYTIQGEFSGEGRGGGNSNFDGLYQMTGKNGDKPADMTSSGTWHVSADLSKETVDEYCSYIKSHADFAAGEAKELQEALRKAKGSDDKMRAIAAYVAAKGFHALDAIEDQGIDSPDFDLELAPKKDGVPDPNFPGREGRMILEEKAERYAGLLADSGANGPAVLGGIEDEIKALRARRAAVQDTKQYTDLPSQLRQDELAKIDDFINQYMMLRDQASSEAVKNVAGEDTLEQSERKDLDDEGKGPAPADPVQRELYELRDRVAGAQVDAAAKRADNAEAFRAISRAVNHLKEGDIEKRGQEEIAHEQQARGLEAQAAMFETMAADRRVEFLHALGNPEEALRLGRQLETLLEAQVQVASAAHEEWLAAGSAAKQITKAGWRKGDFWDDVQNEEEVRARRAEEDAEPATIEMPAEDARPNKHGHHGNRSHAG